MVDTAKLYRREAVLTARPDQLVTMLYDRLIQAMERAKSALSTGGDVGVIHDELVLGQRILAELNVTLDIDRGGELAQNLARLYEFCTARLIAANVSKSVAELEAAEVVVKDIRDAWIAAALEVTSA
jgi:flagellar protein FliS